MAPNTRHNQARRQSSARTVAFTLYPGFQPLDLTGPHEVFEGANVALDRLGRRGPRYELVIAAETAGAVRSESGMDVVAQRSFDELPKKIHTLVIPGGSGASAGAQAEALTDWLRGAPSPGRLATVCTGAFIAADADLLDGLRVTTHWRRAGDLALRHETLTVDPDPIYIKQGSVWTSAGVTAGIDLALALVEEDCGAEIARLVAQYLVVYLHRPGGQSQFATPTWSRSAEGAPIRQACDIIHAELNSDLSVEALASRVGLSARHFARCFKSEVGETVARHVERRRVEAARQLLETEHVGLDTVASQCGFGSAETLRRAFHRRLDLSPDAYRRQFASSAR